MHLYYIRMVTVCLWLVNNCANNENSACSYKANGESKSNGKNSFSLREVEDKSGAGLAPKFHEPKLYFESNGHVNPTNLDIDSKEEALGPETPGTKIFVPRLKRVQEECPSHENQSGLQPGKRSKFLQDLDNAKDIFRDIPDATTPSKFEWLHPSKIRDANRRKPGDPLYDRQSLYIPPEALKNMSASQKQYWSVKCQYMDVVIFFKVVSHIDNFCSIDFQTTVILCRKY